MSYCCVRLMDFPALWYCKFLVWSFAACQIQSASIMFHSIYLLATKFWILRPRNEGVSVTLLIM